MCFISPLVSFAAPREQERFMRPYKSKMTAKYGEAFYCTDLAEKRRKLAIQA
jgi:hypothetical protein